MDLYNLRIDGLIQVMQQTSTSIHVHINKHTHGNNNKCTKMHLSGLELEPSTATSTHYGPYVGLYGIQKSKI